MKFSSWLCDKDKTPLERTWREDWLGNPSLLLYTSPILNWLALKPYSRWRQYVDRIRLITHEHKDILLVDCSGCAAAEMFALIDGVPEHVRKYPRESVLLLGDFSNAEFNRDVVERLKVATVFDRPHLKRSAWVLTANLPPVLYESIKTFSGRELPIFATREQALNYLVG